MNLARSLAASALVVVAALVAARPLAGCSDGEKVCKDYVPPPSFDANAPVSFSKDVMPVFGASCAFPSCHGSSIGNANGVFLGGDDPAKVHQALVGVPARELPTMAFVTPGDPRESFLMWKLDGSQCVLDARCTGGDCGDPMPRNADLLPLESRDAIRRWIAQGAKND